MLACLMWLIVYCLIAVIVVYIVETLLGLWVAFPPAVFVLIRLLAALIVLLLILGCLGLMPPLQGTPPPLLRR